MEEQGPVCSLGWKQYREIQNENIYSVETVVFFENWKRFLLVFAQTLSFWEEGASVPGRSML